MEVPWSGWSSLGAERLAIPLWAPTKLQVIAAEPTPMLVGLYGMHGCNVLKPHHFTFFSIQFKINYITKLDI